MLVTLYLILVNTYNSVEAPSGRGFSFIDTWFVGCQIPILFGIVEYGVILGMKRRYKSNEEMYSYIDLMSFIFTGVFFFLFNLVYWFIHIQIL